MTSLAPRSPLGAILAGGASRRFGAPKALADIGGRSVVERVRSALERAADPVVLITHHPEWFASLDLRTRPDTIPGMGPLGGVHEALLWAAERGRPGALCVACDLPFLPAGLLRRLAELASEENADATVPESTGRGGVEPLCAVYSVRALPEVEARMARGERRMTALLGALRTDRLPLEEVRRFGDPEVLFLNVNTPDDHRHALRVARQRDPDEPLP